MRTISDEMLKIIVIPKEVLLKLTRLELVVHQSKVNDAIKLFGEKDFLTDHSDMISRIIERKRKGKDRGEK